jgi:hypothetical protein
MPEIELFGSDVEQEAFAEIARDRADVEPQVTDKLSPVTITLTTITVSTASTISFSLAYKC